MVLRPGLSVALSTVCLHSWLLSEQQMKSELGKHLINTKLFRSHIFPLSVTKIKTPWTILELWVVVSPFHQWHLKYQHYTFCYLYLVETWWINLKMWASLQKSAWPVFWCTVGVLAREWVDMRKSSKQHHLPRNTSLYQRNFQWNALCLISATNVDDFDREAQKGATINKVINHFVHARTRIGSFCLRPHLSHKIKHFLPTLSTRY